MPNIANKKILLVTRPICPPWDEASKVFAYNLATKIPTISFGLLTKGFIPNLPANITQHPIYTSGNLDFNLKQKIRLLKLIKIRKQYNILHFMLTPAKLNSFAFKNLILHPSIKTVQTVATLREDLFSDTDFKKLFFADLIVTYSDYAKNKLTAMGFQNVRRIYPGINLNHFIPASKNIKLMSDWKISPNDIIITYPGEYTRLGATDDIVNLAINLATTRINSSAIKIIFACRIKNEKDAKKKESIRKKFAQTGILENIIFTDTYDDMERIYNLSDIVLFPVRNMRGKFDVPLAVIEAMACGKPVIISDILILKEFANENNSVIIEAGNIQQLRNSIIKLCQNKNQRDIIGKNARQYVENNFDIKKAAENYQHIYADLY